MFGINLWTKKAVDVNLEKIEEILTRGVAEVIDKDNLRKRLLSGEQLRVKLGIDPTSKSLHIGRAVLLLKLRDFQDLGHRIVFIVGDSTGVIGDTSDKESERPMLSRSDVVKNAKTYIKQMGKVLNIKEVETHYNSEWLLKLNYNEIGTHADQFSVADFIARENIKKRLDSGKRVSLREVLYPLMQAYDSVAVKADVELGGTDQRFNLLAGRKLQPQFKQNPQDILMTNLIMGTDGRKMSSSWGNTINLTDEPRDMYGKIMSIPDELIIPYFIHCTRVAMGRVKEIESSIVSGDNPKDLKMELALAIVELYHGTQGAKKAEESFVNTFQKKDLSNAPRISVKRETLLKDALLENGFIASGNEFKRLITGGGISSAQTGHIYDIKAVATSDTYKIGKRKSVTIKII